MKNYNDVFLHVLANEEFYQGLSTEQVWKTKDGTCVQVSDMEVSHMVNILRLFNKSNGTPPTKRKWINIFTREIELRKLRDKENVK